MDTLRKFASHPTSLWPRNSPESAGDTTWTQSQINAMKTDSAFGQIAQKNKQSRLAYLQRTRRTNSAARSWHSNADHRIKVLNLFTSFIFSKKFWFWKFCLFAFAIFQTQNLPKCEAKILLKFLNFLTFQIWSSLKELSLASRSQKVSTETARQSRLDWQCSHPVLWVYGRSSNWSKGPVTGPQFMVVPRSSNPPSAKLRSSPTTNFTLNFTVNFSPKMQLALQYVWYSSADFPAL